MNEPSDLTRPRDEISTKPTGRTSPSETDRREALRKVGRFSAYVAPAMLAMMSATQATATSDG